MDTKELKILPTLFSKNVDDFKKKFERLKELSEYFHIDIMDGKFVEGTSVNLHELEFIKDCGKEFEVHLMCEDPMSYIDTCLHLGIKKVWIHYEVFDCSKSTLKVVEEIKQRGLQVGIVVNPETKFESMVQIVGGVDSVMFMSVHPGAQGQSFIIDTYQKIRRMHDLDPHVTIQVDGGIKIEEIRRLVHNGANRFCIGSFLNEAEFPEENYILLKSSMDLGKKEKEHVIHISHPYSQITEHIFLGPNRCCQSFDFDKELLDQGIRAEINLEEFGMDATYGVDFYLWIPTKDHKAPNKEQLWSTVKTMDELVNKNVKMYVHCELGHTRSPTMVVAYLMYKGKGLDEAIEFVRDKRPSISITDDQRESLEEFGRELNGE